MQMVPALMMMTLFAKFYGQCRAFAAVLRYLTFAGKKGSKVGGRGSYWVRVYIVAKAVWASHLSHRCAHLGGGATGERGRLVDVQAAAFGKINGEFGTAGHAGNEAIEKLMQQVAG